MDARHRFNAHLARAVRAASDAREPFVYRHRATGTFVDRAFVLATLGCPTRNGGAQMVARDWEPVLIDGPGLFG